MSDMKARLLAAAKGESDETFNLKEPLVLSTVHMKASPYSAYQPMTCNPDEFYVEGVGYKMSDSCGNEMFTKDRTQCAIYFDNIQAIMAKKNIAVIDNPVRYLQRLADEQFMEIWDDEDAKEEIAYVEEIAGILAEAMNQ